MSTALVVLPKLAIGTTRLPVLETEADVERAPLVTPRKLRKAYAQPVLPRPTVTTA